MDGKINRRIPRSQRDTRLNGLIFGLLAGFWLAVGVWVLDAVLLARAQASFPWLKFFIGVPISIVLGGIAGWVGAYFDSSPISAAAWLLAGIGFVWFASHVPFQGLSLAVGLLDPKFAGLEIYPFVLSAQARMSLLYFVVGVLSAIAGGFELFFVEAGSRASSQVERLARIALCLVIFIPIGLVVDNLINAPLRAPVLGVDQLIHLARQARKGELTKDEQRQVGVRAFGPYGDIIERPYRLILGSYDPESLGESSVYTDFSGEWGMCSVIFDHPMVCRLSSERYLTKLQCLIKTRSLETCRLRLLQGASPPEESIFTAMKDESLRYGIIGQRGTAILAVAEDRQGEQVQCLFRESGDVDLDQCSRVRGTTFDVSEIPPTRTPYVMTPTNDESATQTLTPGSAVPTAALMDSLQQTALIDPEKINLPVLNGASRYNIDLTLADDLRSFQARLRMEITNTEHVPLDELYFHLLPNGDGSYGNGSLTVDLTQVQGQDMEPDLLEGNTVLKIPLKDPFQPGETMRIRFEFRGEVPADFGGSATPAGYGIYNLSEGVLALSGWYPILAVYDDTGWNLDLPSEIGDSVYSDMAFYNVSVTLPEDLTVAATGVKVESQDLDGRVRNSFVSGPTRDFFIIASPDFTVSSSTVEGTTLNSYYFPEEKKAGDQALDVAEKSLSIYNDRFGRYPYNELDLVAAPMRNALGVEFPGIVLIGSDLYQDPDKPEFAITVAHEVAHQWWYNTVGNDVFDEPWLDEALATYSSSLYYEFGLGPDYADGYYEYWQKRYDQLLSEGKDDKVTGSLEHFESLDDPSIYGGVVYTKGALFFKDLRQEIGDQAFFQALKDYYIAEYFKIAKTGDLLAAFEKTSGRSLDDFYQKWLYSAGQ